MIAKGTFEVTAAPEAWTGDVATALQTGLTRLTKTFTGDVEGRSVAAFVSAFDPEKGVGSYVAMEAFEGEMHGKTGTFNFMHAASTTGSDRNDEYGRIVPDSGTGDLAGITGTVTLGPGHELTFEYTLS